MKILLVLLLPLFVGCSGWKTYADVGVGLPINAYTDWHLQTDRPWQCNRPYQAHIEVGRESPGGTKVGLNHQSWWGCGSINNRPEVYSNQWVIKHQFGGQ